MEPRASGVVTAEAKPKKGPKMLDELRVKRTLDGGHVVTHHYEGYQHEPKPYAFSKGEGARAMAHIARHAGLPAGGGAAEPEVAEDAGE